MDSSTHISTAAFLVISANKRRSMNTEIDLAGIRRVGPHFITRQINSQTEILKPVHIKRNISEPQFIKSELYEDKFSYGRQIHRCTHIEVHSF